MHAQYQALRRYMKDFGRMDEKPPDSIVLWQQFLVYAVVFDMADQVIKAMQVKVPEVMQDPAFRTMTRSPTRTPLRATSSALCRVAWVMVEPATNTGSSTATGVSAPVRPTPTIMSLTVVVFSSGGNL